MNKGGIETTQSDAINVQEETVDNENEDGYEGYSEEKTPEKTPEDLLYDTDLEMEAPKRRLTFRDISCQDLYIKTCEQLGVISSSYFLKHLNDYVVSMKHHGLGPLGAKAIAAPLVTNLTITDLNLEDNWITHEGMRDLSDMLMENCNITKINLASNKLGSKGARYVCEVLQENYTLTHVNVARNEFRDDEAKFFAETLKFNQRLKAIDLSGNEFCERGGEFLGQGLAASVSLLTVNLSWNHLRRRGAIGIAAGMKANVTIKHLDLSYNGFADEGAKAMGEMLRTNNVLRTLDLSNNRITNTGAEGIAKGLQSNKTLRVLHLGDNPIKSEGALALMTAITQNVGSSINDLGLKGVPVDKQFHELAQSLTERDEAGESPSRMLFSFVVQSQNTPMNVSQHPDSDPVDILQNFLEKKRVRLLDLFKSFDKDQSWKISPEEFRKGVNGAGLKFTKRQMVTLMEKLDFDDDGQVNYQKLNEDLRVV